MTFLTFVINFELLFQALTVEIKSYQDDIEEINMKSQELSEKTQLLSPVPTQRALDFSDVASDSTDGGVFHTPSSVTSDSTGQGSDLRPHRGERKDSGILLSPEGTMSERSLSSAAGTAGLDVGQGATGGLQPLNILVGEMEHLTGAPSPQSTQSDDTDQLLGEYAAQIAIPSEEVEDNEEVNDEEEEDMEGKESGHATYRSVDSTGTLQDATGLSSPDVSPTKSESRDSLIGSQSSVASPDPEDSYSRSSPQRGGILGSLESSERGSPQRRGSPGSLESSERGSPQSGGIPGSPESSERGSPQRQGSPESSEGASPISPLTQERLTSESYPHGQSIETSASPRQSESPEGVSEGQGRSSSPEGVFEGEGRSSSPEGAAEEAEEMEVEQSSDVDITPRSFDAMDPDTRLGPVAPLAGEATGVDSADLSEQVVDEEGREALVEDERLSTSSQPIDISGRRQRDEDLAIQQAIQPSPPTRDVGFANLQTSDADYLRYHQGAVSTRDSPTQELLTSLGGGTPIPQQTHAVMSDLPQPSPPTRDVGLHPLATTTTDQFLVTAAGDLIPVAPPAMVTANQGLDPVERDLESESDGEWRWTSTPDLPLAETSQLPLAEEEQVRNHLSLLFFLVIYTTFLQLNSNQAEKVIHHKLYIFIFNNRNRFIIRD